MGTSPPCRRRTRRHLVSILLWAIVSVSGTPGEGAAQEPAWTARAFVQALSVEDTDDWLQLRQQAARRSPNGRRIAFGVVETRRFGDWDVSLDGSGTLRRGDLHLSLDARVTPEADVLEEARVGARAALSTGELVPSLGYRLHLFPDGPVHTASPRLEWYRGAWLFSGEVRVIRSAVETVNLAGIARVTRRISAGWRVRAGLAAGEEDFRVGRPPRQELRTLTTRSLFGGVEWSHPEGWSVRLDLTGVDSDPRLDRAGGALSLVRSF